MTDVRERHPAGLKVLFFTEMWERFGYYLMLGIFSLYMLDGVNGGLSLGRERAAEIYGTFIALVYLTPFIGGLLADQYLGYRRAVVLGGILMGLGYLGLGFLPGMGGFYVALGLIITGNGFFKPCMSTIVGRLYPDGSKLKDAGYNIFYMGINIGAFICNFAAAILRNRFGWPYAFAAAGIGMFLGVVIFLVGQRHLTGAKDRGDGSAVPKGALTALAVRVVIPAILFGIIGFHFLGGLFGGGTSGPGTAAFVFATIPVVVYYLMLWARAPRDEKGPIGALLAMAGVVIVFWMIFHQNGSSLTYWAEDNTRREAGAAAGFLRTIYMDQDATIATSIPDPDAAGSYWRNVPPAERPAPGEKVTLVSTELFQSINPFFVVVLTPVVVGLFARLRQRGKEPSTPAKIAWGMVITAASTLLMVGAVIVAGGGETKASGWWLLGTYGVITVGELFLSPMGLSMVSKLSPPRVTAVMMGGWFLATAIGNKLAGVLAGFWERIPLVGIFWINCAAALAAAGAIAVMIPWIKRAMRFEGPRLIDRSALHDPFPASARRSLSSITGTFSFPPLGATLGKGFAIAAILFLLFAAATALARRSAVGAQRYHIPLLLMCAVIALIIFVVRSVPRWQVGIFPELDAVESFRLETEARKAVAQVATGVLILIGFYVSWQSVIVAQEATGRSQELAQETALNELVPQLLLTLADSSQSAGTAYYAFHTTLRVVES